MDKLIGKSLDNRYLIQAVIGTGGMAVVYKATDTQMNRTVAVKVLRDECMQNEELVRRFKNESKAISVLDHPNIVKVFDVSVSEKLQYIAMEYIDGITLKEYMKFKNKQLSLKEIMHFTMQTLKALQHAHNQGIVHRDIKPHNIMLLSNGKIKVMDFGIARFAQSENQTMTDKAIGSVHYISPEQAKGDVTDQKADIYSVGVMLYEMLTGKLPFDGESAVGVAIKQISDVAVPIRQVNPNVPSALESITEKAMAKESGERYQSVGAMLADIEAFIKNPNIKFNYKYVVDSSPTRFVDKAQISEGIKKGAPTNSIFTKGKQLVQRNKSSRGKSRSFKNKWIWPVMAGGTLAFFLISVLASFIILQDTILFVEAADADLPNFVGMMRSEVEGNSEYAQFDDIVFEEIYDPENPAGMIISQNPKPPKMIKTTTQITLRVSSGVVQAPIPDILGAEEASAIQAMKDAGFSPMVRYRQVETEADPYGYVLELTLADGSPIGQGQLLDIGTVVQIHVSSAYRDNTVKVPELVGLISVEEAQARLVVERLSIGNISVEDSLLPAGSVIRQSPEYNPDPELGFVTHGTLVDIVISGGHTHVYIESSKIEPVGCTTEGLVTYVCTVCSHTYDEVIPAHGHIWGDWVDNVDSNGIVVSRTRVCTRDSSHTQTELVGGSSSVPPSTSSSSNSSVTP